MVPDMGAVRLNNAGDVIFVKCTVHGGDLSIGQEFSGKSIVHSLIHVILDGEFYSENRASVSGRIGPVLQLSQKPLFQAGLCCSNDLRNCMLLVGLVCMAEV